MIDDSCRVEGCARPYLARGMCDAHYRAFRRGRIDAPADRPPRRPRDRQRHKRCPECNTDFIAATAARIYCSKLCLRRSNKRRHPTVYTPRQVQMERSCGTCGVTFTRTSQFGPTPTDCASCTLTRKRAADLAAGHSRTHYLANRARYRELARAWKAANADFVREAGVRHAAARRARIYGSTVVTFTPDQLAARMSMFSGCWMCGEQWTEIEHVKPLSRGGAHVLANLRPSCGPCNRRKSATWSGVADAMSLRSRRLLAA